MSGRRLADIVFLTDFGASDWYVAAMKGVARGIAPAAGLIDLTHDVAPGDVAQADFVLAQAAPYFPEGTVFCVVVDPSVGTSRRALACGDGKRFYVAPDNGVLSSVARLAGGQWRCHEAANPAWRLPNPSPTFHGRDVFAPVAAWLTREPDLARCGPEAPDPVTLPEPSPERTGPRNWRGRVLYIDRFGNALTSLRRDRPPFDSLAGGAEDVVIELAGARIIGIKATFADAPRGEALVYWGSSGYLEIGVNRGDAAARYGLRAGDTVEVSLPV